MWRKPSGEGLAVARLIDLQLRVVPGYLGVRLDEPPIVSRLVELAVGRSSHPQGQKDEPTVLAPDVRGLKAIAICHPEQLELLPSTQVALAHEFLRRLDVKREFYPSHARHEPHRQ